MAGAVWIYEQIGVTMQSARPHVACHAMPVVQGSSTRREGDSPRELRLRSVSPATNLATPSELMATQPKRSRNMIKLGKVSEATQASKIAPFDEVPGISEWLG
jgi:hypothetical protein